MESEEDSCGCAAFNDVGVGAREILIMCSDTNRIHYFCVEEIHEEGFKPDESGVMRRCHKQQYQRRYTMSRSISQTDPIVLKAYGSEGRRIALKSEDCNGEVWRNFQAASEKNFSH